MAFTLDELNALTKVYVLGQTEDTYFRSHPLLYMLMESVETVDGGLTLDQPLEVGEGNSGVYGNSTVIPVTKKEVFNTAKFPWGAYFASNSIDLDDQRKNNGESAIVKLVQGKLSNIQKTIRKKMAAGIYLDDVVGGIQGFHGLAALFNTDTAVAYGGITETQYANWSANVVATATVANFAGFQTIRRSATVDTNAEGMPDLYLATQLLRDAFEASLQTSVRYSDQKMVNAGFSNILFDGAPVVADLGQTASRVDALNTRKLRFVSHKDYNFTTPKWEYDRQQPDAMTANVRWSGQLTNSDRGAHARYTGVTAS